MATEEPIEKTDPTPDENPGSEELPQLTEDEVLALHGVERAWETTYHPHKRAGK